MTLLLENDMLSHVCQPVFSLLADLSDFIMIKTIIQLIFLRIEGDEYIISLDPPPPPASDPDQPIEPKPMEPYLREPKPMGPQPMGPYLREPKPMGPQPIQLQPR